MSGAPGGGSGSGRDDDPFAVRPATDADRERPAQPLAPIGWGRPAGREPVPAEQETAEQDAAGPTDAGVDPAPADAPQPSGADILAGIVPLDPTEDDERVAPLDQVDADQDAHDLDADLDAPAPEPGIADAPIDAGEVEFPGEPDPGYVPAPAADGTGEVLSGEVETDPAAADDAPAELVLEPVDDAQYDAAPPVVPADAPVVDAELVEDPAAPAAPDDDPVQLTPLRDDRMDEDAEVVDDPAGRVADEVEPEPVGGDVDASAGAGAGAGAERDDEDAAPAPLAPAAAAARAAAMAWASGSAPAAGPAAAAAPAAVPVEAAPAERADAAPTADRPEAATEPEAVPQPETAVLSSPVVEPSDADRAPEHGAEPRDEVAPTAPAPSSFAPPEAAAAEPADAISLLFGDVAADPESEPADADAEDRASDPEGADDRTRILPAAAPAAAPPAAAAARPDRDAPTVAVPAASPRPDPAPRPLPVPPPYAAPPAPRAPAPRAPVLDTARVPAPPAAGPPRGPRGPRRTGLWVGGAILLVLLLVGLFYLGQRLGSAAAPDAAPVATATAEATPTPSPTPTDPVQGPAAAGVQAWDALLGGECIDPYATPWEEEFTVVDCGSEHHAQMVARVALPQTGDTFPGEEAVRDSADELCIADTVIDYAAARAYSDVQYQSAYPISQDEWAAGDRDAYCFVSRAGGGTFTSSIGVPQPPVVP
ncbi:septum formation family protein [Clavibacter sp. VKM Ac-2542]|uniref:septum formation family protein n=1 Tax=Clavibacter sp. VKM Ac-2542 TaxID=2783811 RepID=UPI00188B0FD2|nr:septum formation family protein [Clavibacter sp. VKM Ac-2542]MBF4621057.1 septum formation family protein [Clavibacter sp. VKM Ac-2542]